MLQGPLRIDVLDPDTNLPAPRRTFRFAEVHGAQLGERAIETIDSEVLIAVSDEGPGLDAKLAERLFDPFVTGRAAGTGLGLALVKRVAEEHGGRISLDNRTQGGARAELRLPTGVQAP